jgi:dethiobiotin synthetase
MRSGLVVFVTGTGTGVGKTFVACALVRALRARGVDVGAMKPVATGCSKGPGGRLVSEDASALLAASGASDPLELVTPQAFEPPLAPTAAARLSGASFDKARVLDAFRELASRHRALVVEGVGGLLVPLGERYTVRDLARELGAPLLVVARDELGTINHTALTVEAALSGGLQVRGVVLDRPPGGGPDLSVETNAEEIERLTGVRVLARLGPSDQETAARVFTDDVLERIFGDAWPGGEPRPQRRRAARTDGHER